MKLYAYIILENHLYLIAQSEQLGRDIVRFKSYTAKKLICYLDKNKVKTILEQLAYAFPRRSMETRKKHTKQIEPTNSGRKACIRNGYKMKK